MRDVIMVLGLGLLLAAAPGCGANYFSAKTAVTISVATDGTCTATYTSDKEQMGLEAEVCGGRVKVDKSGTLESVVAASLGATLKMQEMLQGLLQNAAAAAKMGALAGS